MLYIVMLLSLVIQVYYNKPGKEQMNLHPVAYFSGNFNKTQVKWNIMEKEAYAIYKSVKRFAFCITVGKTTVSSDHKPLKNFFEGGMNVAKLDRWSLELQEFDISLEFIQGKLNKIVDVISRLKNEGLYVKNVDEQQVNSKVSLQDKIELLQSQRQDRFCRRLAKNQHKDTNFRINHEGLLVKQISILRNTYQVYVLP